MEVASKFYLAYFVDIAYFGKIFYVIFCKYCSFSHKSSMETPKKSIWSYINYKKREIRGEIKREINPQGLRAPFTKMIIEGK